MNPGKLLKSPKKRAELAKAGAARMEILGQMIAETPTTSFHVVIIANAKAVCRSLLDKLASGEEVTLFDVHGEYAAYKDALAAYDQAKYFERVKGAEKAEQGPNAAQAQDHTKKPNP